ncbi:MAG: MGMT family protein [bacterium]|nr:MGMT family protein [bacterium]
MANEVNKDFNAMMNNSKNMPKIVEIKDEKGIKKWGGKTMVVAPALEYDAVMKLIPEGKVVTTKEIREYIAKKHKVEITCPLTAGIFINICAWASYQRDSDKTPFWRVLKAGGELNGKYPSAISLQKELLEKEGHKIITKGTKNIRYFVKDYENKLFSLKGDISNNE